MNVFVGRRCNTATIQPPQHRAHLDTAQHSSGIPGPMLAKSQQQRPAHPFVCRRRGETASSQPLGHSNVHYQSQAIYDPTLYSCKFCILAGVSSAHIHSLNADLAQERAGARVIDRHGHSLRGRNRQTHVSHLSSNHHVYGCTFNHNLHQAATSAARAPPIHMTAARGPSERSAAPADKQMLGKQQSTASFDKCNCMCYTRCCLTKHNAVCTVCRDKQTRLTKWSP